MRKRRRSLSRSIQRMILVIALIIFVLSSILSWFIQWTEMKSMASLGSMNAAVGIRNEVERIEGLEEYAKAVMETYALIPEDIRRAGGEKYYAFFEEYEKSDYYNETLSYLLRTDSQFLLERTYLGMFDRATSSLVCLMDLSGRNDSGIRYRIGQWFGAEKEDIEEYLSGEDNVSEFIQKDPDGEKMLTTGLRMTDEEGHAFAFVMVSTTDMVTDVMATFFTALYFVIMLVLIILIVIIARRYVKGRLVMPIRRISDAMENYVDNKKIGKNDTFSFKQLDIRTRDELEDLSHVMAAMETDIAAYEENLIRVGAEKERMKTELNVAAQIQLNLLPTNFTALTETKGIDIFACMEPAREVGGDFYDFFLVDDDHLGLVMADVSGKGIPASLFMMASMIIINNLAQEGYSAAGVLERANDRICKTNKVDMFVTVWFGILDLRTGEVIAANAGHEYPAIRHAGGEFELYRDHHGLVIGGMEGMRYRENTFTLEPGSTLFLYTDGVPEATNSKDALYGTDRMIAALNDAKEASAKELLTAVRRDVDAFVQEAAQFDDLTMMGITYLG